MNLSDTNRLKLIEHLMIQTGANQRFEPTFETLKPSECDESLHEIELFFSSNPITDVHTCPQSSAKDKHILENPQICSTCKTPASNYCKACSIVDILQSGHQRTFYCSRACQTSDWPEHKTLCKNIRSCTDRAMLNRAAAVL